MLLFYLEAKESQTNGTGYSTCFDLDSLYDSFSTLLLFWTKYTPFVFRLSDILIKSYVRL